MKERGFNRYRSCRIDFVHEYSQIMSNKNRFLLNGLLAFLKVCPKSPELSHAARGIFEHVIFKGDVPVHTAHGMSDENYWKTFYPVKSVEDRKLRRRKDFRHLREDY